MTDMRTPAAGAAGLEEEAPVVHSVFVPYARFLEFQDRRDRIAAGLKHPDQPPTTGADVPPVPSEKRWRHS